MMEEAWECKQKQLICLMLLQTKANKISLKTKMSAANRQNTVNLMVCYGAKS